VKSLAIALLAAAGCASNSHAVGPLRFHNAEPVRVVNDRKPVDPPAKFDMGLVEYYVNEDFEAPVERALTIEEPTRAKNVNSLGEVPDSAWFTNRRPTPAQVRKGPGADGPDRSEPWHVTGVKVGGAAIGIQITDARGDKYIIKFDERGYPESETSADVIVQRLTWAFGYNVPENNIVTFSRRDVVLDEKAEIKYRTGKSKKMTEADFEHYLSLVEHDGETYRALAIKLIAGKVIGGHEPRGPRSRDRKDRIAHELRRDLRGQRVLWAWVNHLDLKSQNTLATYTDDKYVQWYAIDFGESLGVEARTTHSMRAGYQPVYSLTGMLKNLVTFGLEVQPWERETNVPRLRGLGIFDSEHFDPATWTPSHVWRPTDAADRFDEFWGAEILMRMTREHIAAAVDAGQYTDKRTSEYLVKTLVERQRKLGKYAFSRVAPLTDLEARGRGDGLGLCFDDLWLRYGYGDPGHTSYRTRAYDRAGKRIAPGVWTRTNATRSCVAAPAAHDADGYTIVELEVRRGDRSMPPMFVHIARGPTGPRVIGIDRR